MFRIPHMRKVSYFEDEHRVLRFRRILHPDEGRKTTLIQFWARNGGLRTISLADIIDIT